MVCRPGMSVRDTSQPIGAATTQQIAADVVAMIAVVNSGSRKSGSVNRVTKFCSVGCRALSVKANTASHDIGSTISATRQAANSHSTGVVQSNFVLGVSMAGEGHVLIFPFVIPGRCAAAIPKSYHDRAHGSRLRPSDHPGMTAYVALAQSHTRNNRA